MILALVKACQDQINRSQLIGLGNSTVLGEFLACPARFERATYALEEIVAIQKSMYFKSLHVKTGTV
jgi:hypothetical protein